jgi:D-arabinose 1-dehydrogenase-like Zn-dependent alcohol dehydrogenase
MLSYDVVDWGKPLQKALRDTPKPAGSEVLLKLKFCGVCHSDVHIRDGYFDLGGGKKMNMSDRGMKPPLTLGHEPYGTIIAAGPDAGAVSIGADRVVMPWTGCMNCARCAEGNDNLCAAPKFVGVARPGGYADHLIVPHPRYLVDPQGVDPAFAATLACSGITTYAAINKLRPYSDDDWIMVIGAGGLGLQCVALLFAMGHKRILCADIDAAKLAAARAAGATEVLDTRDADALKKLQVLGGAGVYGVIDLVGAAATASLGIAALRKGGRYVVCGLYGGEIPVSLVTLAQRAIAIQGSYVGTVADLQAVIALAASGRLKPIPIEVRPVAELERTLAQLKDGGIVGRVVVRM